MVQLSVCVSDSQYLQCVVLLYVTHFRNRTALIVIVWDSKPALYFNMHIICLYMYWLNWIWIHGTKPSVFVASEPQWQLLSYWTSSYQTLYFGDFYHLLEDEDHSATLCCLQRHATWNWGPNRVSVVATRWWELLKTLQINVHVIINITFMLSSEPFFSWDR